jgi:hypothetical protein
VSRNFMPGVRSVRPGLAVSVKVMGLAPANKRPRGCAREGRMQTASFV